MPVQAKPKATDVAELLHPKNYPPYREIKKDGEMKINFHTGQWRAWNSKARFPAILCGTQWGKALALDTPIPTPDGFKSMAEIHVGDRVYGSDGYSCKVTYESPVFEGHDCYKVTFDDNSEIIADADHLWQVQNREDRKNGARLFKKKYDRILKTSELFETYKLPDNINNYSIDICKPINYTEKNLPIPPYLLGVWLGDGTSRSCEITSSEPEIISHIQKDWNEVIGHNHNNNRSTTYTFSYVRGRYSKIAALMNGLGLLNNKHIPEIYLTSSIKQRIELLKGLMDTDGYIDKYGRMEFTTISTRLSQDVILLIRSLGIKAKTYTGIATLYGREISPKYRINFSADILVFNLKRKADRYKVPKTPEYKRIFINKIEKIDSVKTRCIQVDSKDHLYLAGKSFIPTHNTCMEPDWLNREIQARGPGDYLVGTATYPLLGLKLLPEFESFFCTLLQQGKYYDSKKTIEFPGTGTRIIFFSGVNPEAIESATALAAVCDEAGQKQFKAQTWEAVRRRLSLSKGRCLFGTTLYQWGWLKSQIYDRWKTGDPEIEVIHGDSIENPAFPKDEYQKMKEILPPWKFDMQYRGRYSKPAGIIYDSFDETNCRIKRFKIPKEWPIATGHDFGGANPAALFCAQVKQPIPSDAPSYLRLNDYVLFDEYLPGAGFSISQHVDNFYKKTAGYTVVSSVGGSHQEEEIRQGYRNLQWNIQEPLIRDVTAGIMNVYSLFKQNKVYVFDDLVNFLDEIETYSWALNDKFEPTDQIEDKSSFHLMDCTRYMFSNSNNLVNLYAPDRRIDIIRTHTYD